MHTQYNNNNTVMNHGYQQSLCQLTVKELKQTDALLVRQIILSMRTCFFLFRTHTHHKNTHRHTRACWRLQMGRETDLPSTGRKRMEEEGKERKEKEKPGVILVRKKKRQKVKSVFLGVGGGGLRRGTV